MGRGSCSNCSDNFKRAKSSPPCEECPRYLASPETREAWSFFANINRQWNYSGFGERIALNYGIVFQLMDLYGIDSRLDRLVLFRKIQVIEDEVLRNDDVRRKSNPKK